MTQPHDTRQDTTLTYPGLNVMGKFGDVNVSGSAYAHIGDVYITDNPRRKNYDAFVDSLFFRDIRSRESEIHSNHEGTFDWVFEADQAKCIGHLAIRDWLEHRSPNPIFWIRGKAGSGKSTLMSFICGHERTTDWLEAWAGSRSVAILNFFFWELGTKEQNTTSGMLKSLLWQFFKSHVEFGFQIWTEHFEKKRTDANLVWNERRLNETLMAMLKLDEVGFCLFLDGLDECSTRESLMKVLQKITNIPHVRVCASSRPEQTFLVAMHDRPSLRLEDLTHDDMFTFATDQLQNCALSLPSMYISSNQITDLVVRLLSKAQGVFIWIRVAVRSLIEGIELEESWTELLDRLNEMPDDIKEFYNHMLTRGKRNFARSAAKASTIFKILLTRESEANVLDVTWIMCPSRLGRLVDSSISAAEVHEIESEAMTDALALAKQSPTQCAWLVEIFHKHDSALCEKLSSSSPCSCPIFLCRYAASCNYIRFMHRTVREFLGDTKEGQDLLAYSSISRETINRVMQQADLMALIFELTARRVLDHALLNRFLRMISQTQDQIAVRNLTGACVMKFSKHYDNTSYRYQFHPGMDLLWAAAPERYLSPSHTEWLCWCIANGWFDYVTNVLDWEDAAIDAESIDMMLNLLVSAAGSIATGVIGPKCDVEEDALDKLVDRLVAETQKTHDAGVRNPLITETNTHDWLCPPLLYATWISISRRSLFHSGTIMPLERVIVLLLQWARSQAVCLRAPPPMHEILTYPKLCNARRVSCYAIREWDICTILGLHDHHELRETLQFWRSPVRTKLIMLCNMSQLDPSISEVSPAQQQIMWFEVDDRGWEDIMSLRESLEMDEDEFLPAGNEGFPCLNPIPMYHKDGSLLEQMQQILSKARPIVHVRDVMKLLQWPASEIDLAFRNDRLQTWVKNGRLRKSSKEIPAMYRPGRLLVKPPMD